MTDFGIRIKTDSWIAKVFEADQAQQGGIVGRKLVDIDKYSSRELAIREAKSQGFKIIEHDGDWLFFRASEFQLIL